MLNLFSTIQPELRSLTALFLSGDSIEMKISAQNLLNTAYQNKQSKSFGLVVHIACSYMGIAEIMNKNYLAAEKLLIESIMISKNNAMYGFGPNTLLCQFVYNSTNDNEVVASFFKISRKKVSFLFRLLKLNKWMRSLSNNQDVDLEENFYYHLFNDAKKIGEIKEKINEITLDIKKFR